MRFLPGGRSLIPCFVCYIPSTRWTVPSGQYTLLPFSTRVNRLLHPLICEQPSQSLDSSFFASFDYPGFQACLVFVRFVLSAVRSFKEMRLGLLNFPYSKSRIAFRNIHYAIHSLKLSWFLRITPDEPLWIRGLVFRCLTGFTLSGHLVLELLDSRLTHTFSEFHRYHRFT